MVNLKKILEAVILLLYLDIFVGKEFDKCFYFQSNSQSVCCQPFYESLAEIRVKSGQELSRGVIVSLVVSWGVGKSKLLV